MVTMARAKQSSCKKTSAVVLLVGLVLLGASCGQAQSHFSEAVSTFMDCYTSCFILCFITPGHTTSYCSLECLKDCIIPKLPLDVMSRHKHVNIIVHPHQFCELGCASVLCSNISTNNNPQGVKVEKCVRSCSNTCTNI
uniref:Thionin-like protein 2 n=1 Tax=Kalanchoe fedtschenkoi TaxID=63787 RepID=A0A7N0TIF9_KALFE